MAMSIEIIGKVNWHRKRKFYTKYPGSIVNNEIFQFVAQDALDNFFNENDEVLACIKFNIRSDDTNTPLHVFNNAVRDFLERNKTRLHGVDVHMCLNVNDKFKED